MSNDQRWHRVSGIITKNHNKEKCDYHKIPVPLTGKFADFDKDVCNSCLSEI